MKIVREPYARTVGILIFIAAVVFTPAAGAQTIHAMLIMMNDAPLTQELNETNLVRVTSHLEEIKDELGCNLTVDSFHPSHTDSEHHATRENILRWLQAVRPAPDDVVFVYYSGEGGIDNKTQELSFTLQDGSFPRKQLAEGIEALPCRLKMLITDTFSFDTPLFVSYHPHFHTTEAYRHLFLEHEGFLNITSASEGELSGGTTGSWSGCSWFTRALLDQITAPNDFNRDDFISWEEVFRGAQGNTRTLFGFASAHFSEGLKRKLSRIGQQSQNPKYYGQLPIRIGTAAQPAADAQTLHALFVILDKNSPHLVSMETIEALLEDVVETTHCNFEKTYLFASKQEMTSEHILQWLAEVRPGRDDIVFLYYSGHGHANEESRQLHLNLLDDEHFPRDVIALPMQGLACRLKILITDSESHGTPITEPLDVFESLYRVVAENEALSREDAYTHLFFQHEGFLNLTAATEGEYAFGDFEGGWFTRSFAQAIYDFHELDFDFDFFISWEEVFQRTRQKTMALFYENAPGGGHEIKQKLKAEGIRSQRPKYYGELPKRINR